MTFIECHQQARDSLTTAKITFPWPFKKEPEGFMCTFIVIKLTIALKEGHSFVEGTQAFPAATGNRN